MDNTKVISVTAMGTKEPDVVGQNVTIDNGKKVISLTTNASNISVTTPSPTALTTPAGGSLSDANSRVSSKGQSPAEENGLGGSGKSAGSSPGALNSIGEGIAKGRSPTATIPGVNLNNNQDNGNVNGGNGVAKLGDRSPSNDVVRSDPHRLRKPIDGDNNISVEQNDTG